MKRIEKKKLSPKGILLIALISALVLLLIGYFLTKGLVDKDSGSGGASVPPEILEGEALYLNSAIAYPRVMESAIQYILVQNKHGNFDLTRPSVGGEFWLGYDAGNGDREMVLYTPPITSAEGDFDYQSLYAKEMGDGYGSIYLLTYLSVALGTPYFNERIELPTNKAERDILLAEYGFDKPTKETISFTYLDGKDENGKDKTSSHSITIGGQAVSGSGYYYMVDNRNCVYYTNTSYFEYALRGFHTFVNGMLIAAGIPSDSAYEPYLTTDFKEWANEKHMTEGEKVSAGSVVVVKGDSLLPLKKPADYVTPEGAPTDGYQSIYEELSFDLEKLRAHHDFDRISAILTSLSVGSLSNKKTITLTLADGECDNMVIDFSEKDAYKYKYSIIAVESVITENDEITTTGEPVGDRDLIKIAYYYYVDGVGATSLPRHAVLDLSSPYLPSEVETALRGASVGGLDTPISFEIDYTEDNSYKVDSCFVLTGITKIYNSKGDVAKKVEENSYVTVRGYELVNGVKGEYKNLSIDLSNVGDIRGGEEIKAAIIGLGRTDSLSTEVAKNTEYFEILRDFTAYTVDEVKYFVTSELITSFRFVNASERDPYYGESFYENTLENEYRFYGLNASACEKVVAYLGGIGGSGSVTSAGFSGETVAVGLNHSNLDKYDLYEYKIYFELPRVISDITEGTEYDTDDMLSDYDWYSTLGFTLHISDKKYDPDTGAAFRYVGSDMYDLVAKVYGEELDFVEYSFVDFWARRNFLLTSIERIENIELDIRLEDFTGKYNFEVGHKDIYIATVGNQMIPSYTPIEGGVKADQVTVYVSASGDNRPDTAFEKIFEDNKKINPSAKDVSISQIYAVVQNGGKPMQEDVLNTVGVSNFRSVFELTQLVRFQDVLTEDEIDRADELEPAMTMKVKMDSSSLYYTYDFIRFDDRRVMVRLYQTSESGQIVSETVSDFYITTFAFKKIVNNYINLLNGVSVDRDIGYFD